MAAAGWRDGRSAVIACDLEGGGESSLLELVLNERWICDRTAQRGVSWFGSVDSDDLRVATDGVSVQEKSSSSAETAGTRERVSSCLYTLAVD